MIPATYTLAAATLAGAVVSGSICWQIQAWRYDAQISHMQARADKDRAARAAAVLQDEQQTAIKESTHATDTQRASDEYTQGQPARDAAARAAVAAADRLRLDAERRAATYRAQAQAGAAACRDLADRHAALDRHIVAGAGVVAGLGNALEQRDAEVKLLRGQVDADRALMQAGR